MVIKMTNIRRQLFSVLKLIVAIVALLQTVVAVAENEQENEQDEDKGSNTVIDLDSISRMNISSSGEFLDVIIEREEDFIVTHQDEDKKTITVVSDGIEKTHKINLLTTDKKLIFVFRSKEYPLVIPTVNKQSALLWINEESEADTEVENWQGSTTHPYPSIAANKWLTGHKVNLELILQRLHETERGSAVLLDILHADSNSNNHEGDEIPLVYSAGGGASDNDNPDVPGHSGMPLVLDGKMMEMPLFNRLDMNEAMARDIAEAFENMRGKMAYMPDLTDLWHPVLHDKTQQFRLFPEMHQINLLHTELQSSGVASSGIDLELIDQLFSAIEFGELTELHNHITGKSIKPRAFQNIYADNDDLELDSNLLLKEWGSQQSSNLSNVIQEWIDSKHNSGNLRQELASLTTTQHGKATGASPVGPETDQYKSRAWFNSHFDMRAVQFFRFKNKSGKSDGFRLMDELAPNWVSFASGTGMKDYMVKISESPTGGSVDSLRTIFQKILNMGTSSLNRNWYGREATTWGGILLVLEEMPQNKKLIKDLVFALDYKL